MRLFVALTPSVEAVEHLRGAVAAAAPATDAEGGVRWSSPESWHITLAFLGEVADAQRSDLERRLTRAAARHPGPRLRLAGAGTFGSARKSRVLWTGVELLADDNQVRDPLPLRRLADSVRAGARRAGIELDARFRGHLSLARARTPTDFTARVAEFAAYAGPAWRADRVELIRSRLGRGPGGGSAYDTVSEFALRGDNLSP